MPPNMGGFLSVLPVVARRVAANARLLAAVVVGAVLAAAIMSTTAIYTDAIRDLGLSYAIREEGPNAINLVIRSTSQSGTANDYNRNSEFIESRADQYFGGIIDGDITSIGKSATFYPAAPGEPPSEEASRDRAHFVFVTGMDDKINVVGGRFPADTPTAQGPPTIDVAVGSETASRLGIELGREFDMHPFWALDGEPVRARVVGLIEPVDLDDEFWVNQRDLFSFRSNNWDTIPMVISRATFFDALVGYLPTMTNDYTRLVYVDTSGINARNAESVRWALQGYASTLTSNVPRTQVTTQLPNVLGTYDQKLFFTRIPLLVLVLQISAIVLYYLFMVSTMLVERQAGEIALLKSRGATTSQVMRIYVIEGLVILALALALGPPLAAAVVGFLGQTPPFHDLSGGANLQVNLSNAAYLWAAGGALLAFITLQIPAYQATRKTMVQQRTASARPPKQAAFTRYYLDLVLVALGGLLLYQLNRRGSLVSSDFFGQQSVDPVVLLTPAFFILTVGLVFLRLFPVVLRILAWAVARAQGAAVIIGMWQLVRNPVHYSRLVLLLMLATAVGMFAASFGSTLDASYADRARYQSGADARISEIRSIGAPGPALVGTTLEEQFGIEKASQVYRLSGSQGDIVLRTSFDILGVEPETFDAVTYFREDFAAGSLGSLLEELGPSMASEDYGFALPADARWVGIWVNPVEMPSAFGLIIEARDATGRYFSFNVGPDRVTEMEPGWNLLVGDLQRPLGGNLIAPAPDSRPAPNGPYPLLEPQAPLTVTSLSLRSPTRFAAPSGRLQFDDLHTSSAPSLGAIEESMLRFDPRRAGGNLPDARIVNAMDASAEWQTLQGILPGGLNDVTRTVSDGSFTAIELSWTPQQGQIATRGLVAGLGGEPLPVLASAGFLARSGLQVGDVTQIFVNSLFVNAQVVGSFDLFPTLNDTRREPALITNGTRLGALINSNPRGPQLYPGEVWLKTDPSGVEQIRGGLDAGMLSGRLTSLQEIQMAQEQDPLVAAGWEGILFISFAAILLLSAIGFLIYSYLTAQRRTLEFAVLRTMGFSKRQIALVVGFEQFFVIGLGMIAGTLMGMRLGSLMIRYMGLTETGDEVVPPMHLEVSWLTIGSAWLILGAVFLVTIAAVVLLYSRLALHRVLRIGEA